MWQDASLAPDAIVVAEHTLRKAWVAVAQRRLLKKVLAVVTLQSGSGRLECEFGVKPETISLAEPCPHAYAALNVT